MIVKNQTIVTEFFLLGFQNLGPFKFILFAVFLVNFLLIWFVNFLIIVLVRTSHQLHTPMYYFLSHLSVNDLLVSGDIVPKVLHITLAEGATISFSTCIFQFFIFSVSETAETFLLTAMAYDRYLAICKPLHYISIMNHRLQFHLVFWSWGLGFIVTLNIAAQICRFQFCDFIIDHLFCDSVPLLSLSCSDTYLLKHENLFLAAVLTIVMFLFIFVTYVKIFVATLRNSTNTGRQKTFSTCISHLIVVSSFYGTLITVYGVPSSSHSSNLSKGLSLLYILATPLLNPITYSLRSQDIKKTFWKMTGIKEREY
ncbi:hypothetical protein GDO86_019707 [Hymenochirus boettgeri]|uniref:Olfactory receptor n=1 Tax=Hymenochirus boettgeri TaxID=247094 RepID=A0A8T2ICD3_9PIPI|nr:hypothetical protein GDO86_019048 [Hymenochirus boettgeri]KAG8431856.1 hypothetical protein GDO86_019707 [Hymenochirus boettgeri]